MKEQTSCHIRTHAHTLHHPLSIARTQTFPIAKAYWVQFYRHSGVLGRSGIRLLFCAVPLQVNTGSAVR